MSQLKKGDYMNLVSFFAGVGGIDKGFENAGFKTLWANELDTYAAETFKANFNCNVVIDDIKNVDAEIVPDHTVLIAGFPCQPFSLAGYRKGFEDERGNVFFDLMKIVDIKKSPILFLENVKNLVSHDDGNTFKTIIKELEKRNYTIKYQILNASMYGNVPQNRERIYIVAFKDAKIASRFHFPEAVPLTNTIGDIIDFDKKVDDNFYYTERNCSFYSDLLDTIKKDNTIYQWRRIYVRENKSCVCPTLTANMGTGGHNVPLVKVKHGIRKLTPRECFKFQGYDKEFKLPENMSNTRLYKQAGNSVVIPVIERIAIEIKKALE